MTERSVILRLWMAAAIATCIASVLVHMMIGLNSDHLDLLDQVRRMLAGGTPYVAFSDVNPPLIHMLYTLPVALADRIGFSLMTALNLFTLGLIGVSLYVCSRLLAYSNASVTTRRLTLSTIALALLGASFIHQAFGDRDHLMLVLASPWLVLYSPLARRELIPARWRAAAAVMGAVGFAIKPYFYLLCAVSTGFCLLRGTSVRALLRQWEPYVIVAFALLYLAVIFAFFPVYPAEGFPLAFNTYGKLNWGMDPKFGVISYDFLQGYGIPVMAGLAALTVMAPALWDSMLAYLLVLLAAGISLFLMQGGWYYTQYNFIALSLVVIICLGSKLVIASDKRGVPAAIAVLLAAALGIWFVQPAVYRIGWDVKLQRDRGHPLANIEMPWDAMAKLEPHLATHPRFIFLSINLRATSLLKEGTPRANVGRFDYLWPLAGVLALENQPGRQHDYERFSAYLSGAIASDIAKYRPDMVINDVSPFQYQLPGNYNVVPWLKRDPRFVQAWKDYRLATKFNTCHGDNDGNCAYEIYYRK